MLLRVWGFALAPGRIVRVGSFACLGVVGVLGFGAFGASPLPRAASFAWVRLPAWALLSFWQQRLEDLRQGE